MTGVIAVLAASKKTQPITLNADWGSSTNTAPGAVTSPTRTLTVPSGNPGVLKFAISPASAQYSKNGGAFTTINNNDTLSVANGDTLALRNPAPTLAGVGISITVTDNTTTATVGTASLDPT